MNKRNEHNIFLLKFIWPMIGFVLIAVIVFAERMGVSANLGFSSNIEISGEIQSEEAAEYERQADTLVLSNYLDEMSNMALEQLRVVLDDMRVHYDVKDVRLFDEINIDSYDKIIMTFTGLNSFGDNLVKVGNWVKKGGSFMNVMTYDVDESFEVMKYKMGVYEGGTDYIGVSGIHIQDGFMIGGDNRDFYFDDVYEASVNCFLSDDSKVFITSTDNSLPLLWETDYGEGKFVTINLALSGKVTRGFWAAEYSLLDDVCIYPVIDASAYYLDDFPSPVPAGSGKYIKRDYSMSVGDFYLNIWWRDVMELEKKYGIVHTGLIIEDYSDVVEEPFIRNESTHRFLFLGNMLINQGGELGLHGYNHMPLCLQNFDYKGLYDSYILWKSENDMQEALKELDAFAHSLFEQKCFSVYVPPSNILSNEGRETIKKALPEINCIASTYLGGECAYEQEFEVAEDGIVETPRIVSGAIMDDFSYLIAFSELNFHFVQSHFMHPDDVLDEDRGASLGWEKLHDNLEEYIEYISDSAKQIENVTGSGMMKKVVNYKKITISQKETEEGVNFDIGGFEGEASILMRINEGTLDYVKGAAYEKVTGNIYFLRANTAHVEVYVKAED